MDRSQKRIRPITKAEDLIQVVILRPMMGFYLSEVSWEGILIMENLYSWCIKSGIPDGSKVLQAKGAVYMSTDSREEKDI